MSHANAIPTSSFLPPDELKPGMIVPTAVYNGRVVMPDEHNPNVLAQNAASYEDLMRENAKLRAAIRHANASIERMLGEIDVMVAKLKGVGKCG